ncbi:DNA polymerase IV [uncultured Desulfovibrio sp.]|uniref:DNA polymerase IV n=1 Tax=uncultured Desulfovibrio sp. TaxID=167968 RepID=UPI0026282420|nr:DNA polymerase IV [uncultured Desulfovibrio sp.]
MIVHLDMDAFFASVEQLDDPDLRGKPVIIGGGSRGVVSTASYEARVFGVRSAMPIATARKLCPQGIFVRGRTRRYVELSRRIMTALRDFSPLVEPASVDEAYLDASGLERLFGPPERLLPAIKARVADVTGGLTCSVGAAPIKFLAKICSEVNKPDGIFILPPDQVDAFLLPLAVERLPGVGKRMARDLHALGISRVEQLRRYSPRFMEDRFGKWGLELLRRAHGIDPRPVCPEHVAKSESAETTFAEDTRDRAFLEKKLLGHAERVGASLRRHGWQGRTITLKIKFADFRQITRSRTLPDPTCATQTIFETACDLLRQEPLPQPVRLVGLGVSGFDVPPPQQALLPGLPPTGTHDPQEEARRLRLDKALDSLRQKFGTQAVQRGRLFTPPDQAE